MPDGFGDYLKSLKCTVCGEHATHRQDGKLVCNKHIKRGGTAPPVFAIND